LNNFREETEDLTIFNISSSSNYYNLMDESLMLSEIVNVFSWGKFYNFKD